MPRQTHSLPSITASQQLYVCVSVEPEPSEHPNKLGSKSQLPLPGLSGCSVRAPQPLSSAHWALA